MYRTVVTVGVLALIVLARNALHAPEAPTRDVGDRRGGMSARSPVVSERMSGVSSAFETAEGHRVRLAAETIESPPMRLLGPVRLGFLRSAVASDVRIDVAARRVEPAASSASPSLLEGLRPRLMQLDNRQLAGLEITNLDVRLVDPIGRTLMARARRCEMDSPASVLCFDGQLNFGPGDIAFARARFDRASWQVLEGPGHRGGLPRMRYWKDTPSSRTQAAAREVPVNTALCRIAELPDVVPCDHFCSSLDLASSTLAASVARSPGGQCGRLRYVQRAVRAGGPAKRGVGVVGKCTAGQRSMSHGNAKRGDGLRDCDCSAVETAAHASIRLPDRGPRRGR